VFPVPWVCRFLAYGLWMGGAGVVMVDVVAVAASYWWPTVADMESLCHLDMRHGIYLFGLVLFELVIGH